MYHAQAIILSEPEAACFISYDPYRLICGRGRTVEAAKDGYFSVLGSYHQMRERTWSEIENYAQMDQDQLQRQVRNLGSLVGRRKHRNTIIHEDGIIRLSQWQGEQGKKLYELLRPEGQDLEVQFFIDVAVLN